MDLFRKKSVDQLVAESTPLKRTMRTFDLTVLAIGAIIGTGIFVLTGKGALTAGPALSVSFLLAAVCCGFAGLCYAEFAAMAPVSGSAYSYAYLAFGELIASVIGWDLILEYALQAATVSAGWSGYFNKLLEGFGLHLPVELTAAYGTNPEAVTENKSVDFADVRAQYNEEFVGALGSAINQYSADGERISFIKSKQRLIGQYMAQTLDEEWTQARGMEVFAVGMDVSYTEDSQELINMRNKGAMLSDAAVQQGYVAANISEGLKDAGSNANGAMAGFMGMGIGMNAGGNIMGGYQQNPQYRQQQPTQPQQQAQPQQTPAPQAGGAAAGSWTCSCGAVNTGKFCSECGSKKPEAPKKRFCTNCGYELSANAKFCPECGTKTE